VRELQGIVFDAVARSKAGKLSQEPFRQVMSSGRTPSPVTTLSAVASDDQRLRLLESIWGHFPTLDEAEDYLVDVAMTIAKGNQGTAATMLGLKRQTFNIRLKKKSTPG
jgi:DNA-binding NtrC family response regulator